jgi:hypothetical protein
VVLGFVELRIELAGQALDHARSKLGVRVDAGPDGGASDRQLLQRPGRGFGPSDAVLELARVSRELLPEAHGRGVLKMCPPGLCHVVELLRLRLQCLSEAP